jgi:hypothetical protein
MKLKIEYKSLILGIFLILLLVIALINIKAEAKVMINVSQEFGGYGNTQNFEDGWASIGGINTFKILTRYNYTLTSIYIMYSYGLTEIHTQLGDTYLLKDYNGGSGEINGYVYDETIGENVSNVLWFFSWYCNQTLNYDEIHIWFEPSLNLINGHRYMLKYFNDEWFGIMPENYLQKTLNWDYQEPSYPPENWGDIQIEVIYIGQASPPESYWIARQISPDYSAWVGYSSLLVYSHLIYANNINVNDVFNMTYVKHNLMDVGLSIVNLDTMYEEFYKRDNAMNYSYANFTLANRRIYLNYYENNVLKQVVDYTSIANFTIPEGIYLSGYVLDAKTLSYVKDVNVSLNFSNSVYYDLTNEFGFYAIYGLSKNTYLLKAEKEGYQTYSTNITLNKNTNFTIYLIPIPNASSYLYNNSVYGIIYDSNRNPLENVFVSIANQSVLTNEFGYFEIFNITSGNYSLKAEKENYITYNENIQINESESYYREITLLSKYDVIKKDKAEAKDVKKLFEDIMVGFISGEKGKIPNETETLKFLLAIAVLLLIIGIYDLIFGKKK